MKKNSKQAISLTRLTWMREQWIAANMPDHSEYMKALATCHPDVLTAHAKDAESQPWQMQFYFPKAA